METEHALKQIFKIAEYPFSALAEIKITIVKKPIFELVLVMTLLSHNLIETEHALK